MFIKKSWFRKNGKKYITYQVAKSYRPKGKKHPRTKILATITSLGKPLIDKIALLLRSPNSKVIHDLNSFFKESYVFGPILLLYLFMKKLGIVNCLSLVPRKALILLIAVLLNKILEPRSKLGSVSWVKRTAFPYIFGIDKDELNIQEIYRAMDLLYQRMDKVLGYFFKENKGSTVLLLYDITSVFFEGRCPQGLSKYGFSKDKRNDNPQIILSLCLNEERLPVHFDILEGNALIKRSFSLIKKLSKRFDLTKSIFIGDKEVVTAENIDFLEKGEIDYILALTHKEAKNLLFSKEIQLEPFDKRIPVTVLIEEDGKIKRRYVLCGSEYRKERDLLVLEHLLEKGEKGLESIARMVETGRLKDYLKVIRRAQKKLTASGAESFFDFRYEDGRFQIIEKRDLIEKARALCGYYLLQTTLSDLEDKEIEAHYKGLKFVEDVFRQLKDLVEIRPIFHWKERRVRTHIFLCVLAQTVVNKMKEILKDKGWLEKGNSFSHLLDIFYESSLGIFEIEGKRLPIISQLTEKQKECLNLFNLQARYFSSFDEAKKAVD